MSNYLYDVEFLKQLDYFPNKITYAKITRLDLNDFPLTAIEGKVSGGSVNIDGASAVRRTCQLTLAVSKADDELITNKNWPFNEKFKLEIGIQNDINPAYPDIIWFNQGIYLISSFNASQSTNNISVSISGKDKMCRLNGEIGGTLPMDNDFGQIEYLDVYTGNIELQKIPIETIIRNAVKEYAQEREENIIIRDLDKYGYELWEYRGDTPMYMLIQTQDNKPSNITFNDDFWFYFNGKEISVASFEKCGGRFFSTNTLDPDYNAGASKIQLAKNGEEYFIAQIKYGDTAGYHRTKLVYNGDLILKAGETVMSLLDKIKNMLGNFEYFYNVDGQFIFQKKNTYIQELFSSINGKIEMPFAMTSLYHYKFDDLKLFTSISSPPKLDNVKNSFSVWGSRKTASGTSVPIHARCAIDKKPISYKSAWERYIRVQDIYFLDIREITKEEKSAAAIATYYKKEGDNYIESEEGLFVIQKYQTIPESLKDKLSSDNLYKQTSLIKYEPFIIGDYWYNAEQNTQKEPNYQPLNNLEVIKNSRNIYTKIEDLPIYTIDEYDWRELIYQMALDFYQHNEDSDYLVKLENNNPSFINGTTGYEQYYSDLQAFWRQLYNPNPSIAETEQYGEYYGANEEDKYWNKKIHTDPMSLNFWIDFLDTTGDLNKYSIKEIGIRPKVVNETAISSIYYKEVPEILFVILPDEIYQDDDETFALNPVWIQEDLSGLFTKSAQSNSAISRVNELIQAHSASAEGLSITSIPIYYLQPNTRIYIEGYGDYTLDKISYSLNYNGTMNLTGTKILDQIY